MRYSDNSQRVIIADDGRGIPVDPANADYQALLASGVEILPFEPPPPTSVDVQAERARRLGLGFDYDFGDARGVHRIGTTPADMEGWDEVSKLAAALIATGNGSTQIAIVTDTGPANVTALEWQGVLVAAAQFRQPIWAGSFALQAMTPIPADFATNDQYWSA